MKKRYLSFLTCLALSGCSVYQDSTPQGLLNEVTQLSKTNAKIYTTMNKELYSYYLPKDVGRIKSGSLSSLYEKWNEICDEFQSESYRYS